MKAVKLNPKPLAKTKRAISANRNNIHRHTEHNKQQHNDNDISNLTTIKKSKSLSKNSSPTKTKPKRKPNSRSSSPVLTVYKVIQNAKDLLTIQTSIIEQCDSLNKRISETELEFDAKLNTNKNHFVSLTNTLNKVKNTKCNQCEHFQCFILTQLNSVNELIGKLGYNYVFHKFKTHNFTMENIATYFSNIKQLLISLHEQNEKLQNLLTQHNTHEHNVNITQQTNITTLPYNTNIKEEVTCGNNVFTNESSMNMNVFGSGSVTFMRRNNNEKECEMKPELERKSNNEVEMKLSQSSNLFDSGTFFAEYKRNKEMRNELELHYTEGNNSNLVSKNYDEFHINPNENNWCNTTTNNNNHINTLSHKQNNKLFFK